MDRLRLVVVTALLLWIPAAACAGTPDPTERIPVTTASPEARAEFLKGRELVDNLRLTDGIGHFQKAVQIDTGFALAYLYLAQTAPTPGLFFTNLEKAVACAAAASEGERLWITGARAGAYGDPAGQREKYERLTRLYPDDERASMLLGVVAFGQQEYDGAVTHLKKAITINPRFAPAYNQLGYAYRFINQYDEAEKIFKAYTELIPDDPNPYDSYAELLLKRGRFDAAIEQYRKALSVDPAFANSYAGIAAALAYQGKHEEARAELAGALKRARTDAERRGALFSMTVVAIDRGDWTTALQDVDRQFELGKAINDAPAMSGDCILKGNILLERGKGKEALSEFTRAVELIKKSDVAPQAKENAALFHHYNVARAAVVMNDLARAEKEAAALRTGAEAKRNQNQIRLAHECAGMIALARGEYQKAVDELRAANQQNPYNLFRLAKAYRGLGDGKIAREFCSAAAGFYGLPLPNYAFVRTKALTMLSTL